MVNTRLHSAFAENNWSYATASTWSSFETLGRNEHKNLGKELVSWKHTHQICTSFLPISVWLSFSPVYYEDHYWFFKRPLAVVVQAVMLSLLRSKDTQTEKTLKLNCHHFP